MSLALLLPAGLVALLALLLPLLLHLDRQTEPRRLDFAALRWLTARLRPQHRIRVRELILLLLRLLLVATVAALFAGPALHGAGDGLPRVLVHPGVDLALARKALGIRQGTWQWLAPGFPGIDQPAPRVGPGASLLREFDARLPANVQLTVLVPPYVDGLDGERPRLSRQVGWRVVPAAAGQRTADAGDFPSGRPANAATEPADARVARPPVLVVRHAADRGASLPFLRAAAVAWKAPLDLDGIDKPLPPGARWLVWLAPGALPAEIAGWVKSGGTALVDASAAPELPDVAGVPAWRDARGQVLARAWPLGRGRVVRLGNPLLPAAFPLLLEPAFPEQLIAVFEPPPAPGRGYAAAFEPLRGAAGFAIGPQPLDPWLALLAALLLLVERLWATSPQRWSR